MFPDKLILLLSMGWLLTNGFLVTHFIIHNKSFPPFYIMNGIMGGLFLKSLSDISIRYTRGIKCFLEHLGRCSMSIMLWHFLSFKIVSFVYIRTCSLPDYYLASFPYLKVRYLWIAYSIVGILLPLLADYIVRKCQIHILTRIGKLKIREKRQG